MKKFVSIIAILLMLSLAACSNQDTPSAADNPSNTQTESNTMLDAVYGLRMNTLRGFPSRPVRSVGLCLIRNMRIAVSVLWI